MATAKRVVVTSKDVTDKTGDKGSYKLYKYGTAEGLEFALFGNANSTSPRVNKKEININVGDAVQVIFEQQGKNTRVLEAAVVEAAQQDSPPPFVSDTYKSTVKTTANITVDAVKPGEVRTYKLDMTKDVSMELSGIIQALLGTGHYHQVKKTPEGFDNVYINDTLLKMHVERILAAKDVLAQQRQGN